MTDETRIPVVETIKRLLRLAEGAATEHEAAAAAGRAAALMAKHRIEQAALTDAADEPIRRGADPMFTGTQAVRWIGRLAYVVAASQNCRTYWHNVRPGIYSGRRRRSELTIVGRASDVQVVRYMFAYLRREIDRLTQEALADGEIEGRTDANNFRFGAIDAIDAKLSEAKRDVEHAAKCAGQTFAIVRVDAQSAELDTWMKKNVPGLRSMPSRSNYSPDAREKGRAAGESISIRKGIEGGGGHGGLLT